jgi:hypothetical protein
MFQSYWVLIYDVVGLLTFESKGKTNNYKYASLMDGAWEPYSYEGTPDESSWEPTEHLEHVLDLVHKFHCQHPDKPGPA